MNPMLILHFLRGITNAKKMQIICQANGKRSLYRSYAEKVYVKKDQFHEAWDLASELALKEHATCLREGVELLYADDPKKYPSMLQEIADPPMVLFGRGQWQNVKIPLAVIGSRKLTSYGKHQCKKFVEDLSRYPINIVSGMALGIDAVAHKTALDCGATTQAFLAGGLGHISPPSHQRLAQRIVDQGGGYFTEQPFGQASLPQYYPVRNRLIAGSSLATFIVEAARKSGAMITANQAHAYGREVFALPGALFQPMSEGPNRLIAENVAQCVLDTDGLVSNFYPIWAKNDVQLDLTEELEGRLIQHFPHGRKVHSGYLKEQMGVGNIQLFKALQVLLDYEILEKIGPHTYTRKTA